MNKPDSSRRALGKGLSALLPTRSPVALPTPLATAPETDHPDLARDTARDTAQDIAQTIPIAAVDPNPAQPRRAFPGERLAELAQSIRANGIIQPLVVRRAGDRYQLVAGERRWRAAKLAGLESVPVVIQNIPDDHLLEITLIENIQREDLNPIETAIAFDRMVQELQLTTEEIGRRTGKDRSTIVNTLRLLQLPRDIQQMVAEGALTAGHARCLLKLPDAELQREVAIKAAAGDWSVRQLERTTTKIAEAGTEHAEQAAVAPIDPNVKAAITEMERALGTKVRIIEKARGKGRIEIEYYSAEDLDRIYEAIVGPPG
jgi:ParB family transcriptional regulator, chromosome partitioning protein